jgi:hypothetical protein
MVAGEGGFPERNVYGRAIETADAMHNKGMALLRWHVPGRPLVPSGIPARLQCYADLAISRVPKIKRYPKQNLHGATTLHGLRLIIYRASIPTYTILYK